MAVSSAVRCLGSEKCRTENVHRSVEVEDAADPRVSRQILDEHILPPAVDPCIVLLPKEYDIDLVVDVRSLRAQPRPLSLALRQCCGRNGRSIRDFAGQDDLGSGSARLSRLGIDTLLILDEIVEGIRDGL